MGTSSRLTKAEVDMGAKDCVRLHRLLLSNVRHDEILEEFRMRFRRRNDLLRALTLHLCPRTAIQSTSTRLCFGPLPRRT